MYYLVIIILALFIVNWVSRRTFYWETIIKYLWRELYKKADVMSVLMKSDDNMVSRVSENYKAPIMVIGNLINSILDFINYFNKEKDENAEEETFGYGRFNYEVILKLAKTNPGIFKNVK